MDPKEVLGAVKRIMRERGGPSLLMTIAVLGWSIKYPIGLGLAHTSGAEMHGVLVAALAVGGALLNLTLFASSQQRLAATAGVLVRRSLHSAALLGASPTPSARYPATARSTFDHGRSRHPWSSPRSASSADLPCSAGTASARGASANSGGVAEMSKAIVTDSSSPPSWRSSSASSSGSPRLSPLWPVAPSIGGPTVIALNGATLAGTLTWLVVGLPRSPRAVAAIASWIGALLNTFRLDDKTWFVSLLVLGLCSFGWLAMAAYVVAGPDSTKPGVARPGLATTPS